jgi:hypothetical protein
MIAAKAASVASSPTGKRSSKLSSKKSLEPHSPNTGFVVILLYLASRFQGRGSCLHIVVGMVFLEQLC